MKKINNYNDNWKGQIKTLFFVGVWTYLYHVAPLIAIFFITWGIWEIATRFNNHNNEEHRKR